MRELLGKGQTVDREGGFFGRGDNKGRKTAQRHDKGEREAGKGVGKSDEGDQKHAAGDVCFGGGERAVG